MPNTAALTNSFKTELMLGIHNFGAGVIRAGTGADSFKGALYLASATLNNSTTVYAVTGEVVGTNYTAGGVAVTNGTVPSLSVNTAVWTPSGSLAWINVTLATAFDTLLLYNSTQANRAVGVYTFGAQTITAGNFTLTMPVNDSANALVRIA